MADLNQDGIPDVSQINEHFKVLNSTDGSGPIALETANINDIIEYITSIGPDAYPDEAGETKPEDIPFGLLSFRLRPQNSGDTSTVIVYFSEPLTDEYLWYKYDHLRGWYIFPDATFGDNRRSLTFSIQDGGNGDADGLVNGIIVDPSGAGADPTEEITVPQSGSSGISGSGGICFVAATDDLSDGAGLNSAGYWRFLLLFIPFCLAGAVYGGAR
jgi:hypothetical protein